MSTDREVLLEMGRSLDREELVQEKQLNDYRHQIEQRRVQGIGLAAMAISMYEEFERHRTEEGVEIFNHGERVRLIEAALK